MAVSFILAVLMSSVVVIHAQPACTSCPANGIWSKWSDSTSCSVTCGLYGTKSQTRTCTSESLGCPCTGNTDRTIACPISPLCNGAAAVQCKAPYQKYINFSTKRYECGNVTSSDDDQPAPCTMTGPACGFCTSTTPNVEIVIDGNQGNKPFDTDTVAKDGAGCSVRTFTCVSNVPGGGWPATINVNANLLVADNSDGSDTATYSMTCNSDGTAWSYTFEGATEDITKIGCFAVTCETDPSVC